MRISDWSSDVCSSDLDKRIVLNLTLGSHLKYDWNEGVRTAELSLPFMVLGRLGNRETVMTEREGFEPSIRLPVCRISSAVHSTTLPPDRKSTRLNSSH